MAKTSAAKTDTPTTQPTDNQGQPAMSYEDLTKVLDQAPEGFQKQSGDAKAFWDPDLCNILCIPRAAKLFDGNQDPKKPSMLIIVELSARTPLRLAKEKGAPKEDKGEVIICNPGDMVGIWGKPGMRDIRDLCGIKTWVHKMPERLDVGKGQPMVQYDVRGPKRGTRIPIIEDLRKESRGVATFLDVAIAPKASGAEQKHGEDDDIPF